MNEMNKKLALFRAANPKSPRVVAFTDGGARLNNSKDPNFSNGDCAYAFVIFDGDNPIKLSRHFATGLTNNQAEWMALRQLFFDVNILSWPDLICSDSRNMVEQFHGRFKIKENVILANETRIKGKGANLIWVPREQNPADVLCNVSMDSKSSAKLEIK